MAKFTVEDKIRAARAYLAGQESKEELAKRYGVNARGLQQWVELYRHHGEDGLRKRYTNYTAEFKLDVLNFMKDTGASSLEAAAVFNIPSRTTVGKWKKAMDQSGTEALIPMKKGRPPMKNKPKKPTNPVMPKESLQEEVERLRMENAYFKKVECLSEGKGTLTTQLKAQVIYELRHDFKVVDLIKVAALPRSTYYYWIKHQERPDKYKEAKELISAIFHAHKGRYGHRNIHIELRKRGIQLDPKTVLKLMKTIGLTCRVRMKKYRSYRGSVGKVAPNVLGRDFSAEKPNQKWVTDVTEFALFGQKLYLSPVLDLFNSEIIAYTVQGRPTFDLVSTMLEQAFERLDSETELVLHSDLGWQYQMAKYQKALANRNITQSMSRKGNCLDNAVIENFFGILKTELLYLQEFESVEHFLQELDAYMVYYNQKRMKSKLKNMSPVDYRTHVQQAA
ncbi:IS3 family transposase [Planomicrobium sp. CPCC 101110]|uniref:IS3 family transposase n=1 Tax=Planomicrobium sp. CPCC 101110 TaxID=2599619 RepID=UPI0011B793A7|nr:IS3 family transposase [Planomicrobium sp. CPCC 101110]TWT27587.1 IS3 family transposase [Planomicrobium sp. CPCC 101110]